MQVGDRVSLFPHKEDAIGTIITIWFDGVVQARMDISGVVCCAEPHLFQPVQVILQLAETCSTCRYMKLSGVRKYGKCRILCVLPEPVLMSEHSFYLPGRKFLNGYAPSKEEYLQKVEMRRVERFSSRAALPVKERAEKIYQAWQVNRDWHRENDSKMIRVHRNNTCRHHRPGDASRESKAKELVDA